MQLLARPEKGMFSRLLSDNLNFDLNLDLAREASLWGMVISSEVIVIKIKQGNDLKPNMQRNLRRRQSPA